MFLFMSEMLGLKLQPKSVDNRADGSVRDTPGHANRRAEQQSTSNELRTRILAIASRIGVSPVPTSHATTVAHTTALERPNSRNHGDIEAEKGRGRNAKH
jgi:hypothetical protein